jgi:hypothetical protein
MTSAPALASLVRNDVKSLAHKLRVSKSLPPNPDRESRAVYWLAFHSGFPVELEMTLRKKGDEPTGGLLMRLLYIAHTPSHDYRLSL